MKKITVEECEYLNISTIIYHLRYDRPLLQQSIADALDSLSQRSMTSEFAGLPHLHFTTTRCYFGGVRYWFLCPACSKRVGKLYASLSANEFKCRHCHNLTYRSSQTHNQRVNSLSKQLNEIYAKEGDEALTQAIRDMQRTLRGIRLLWKLYDKQPLPFSSPYLIRKKKEEEAYSKYVKPLFEI